MTSFADYENLVQIHNSENSRVYRGQRMSDQQPVILKILQSEYPTPNQLRRYRQEYSLTRQLQLPGIIHAYGLETWQRTLVMILEDFGGKALQHWIDQYPQGISLELFWLLAIQIADALGQLHSQSIIHKDINPSNIVLNPDTRILKLIDLGISTQLPREAPALQPPSALEGTLPYLSPEQTGRMNRSLDYRSDFYSLGVTFYELLTGTLPFSSTDPMELVHCHIAKQPIGLGERVPEMLERIVIKLMAKNAEDRYQSAWGLKVDLQACAAQWQATGEIELFELGQQDRSDRFQIPQKLYGRDREIAALLAAFERVVGREPALASIPAAPTAQHASDSTGALAAAGCELVLVTGYSGIGKSALVRSLYKPITAQRGYFIAGKFDQFQRNIPYSAVVHALGDLVRQWLGEPESRLRQWRTHLLAALGSNGQVVIDVIPEVELIVGPQPPLTELGAREAQNRFNWVFQRFMQACCSPDHPLVLFLDDLQWADLATLSWLEWLLAEAQIPHLLLIAAYRDQEVSIAHPLSRLIAQLQRQTHLEQITLTPLSLEQVAQLIGETLHQDAASVLGLAELVVRKTAGNPFFTNQFLQTLYREALLSFDYQRRCWQWDLDRIEQLGLTDNVVELMLSQLQKFPASVQAVLATAAYLGAEFDLETLALVRAQSPADLFADLQQPLAQGLVVARSPLDADLLIQDYQFGHDRIQQAAYSLIPTDRQAAQHLQIGRVLLTSISSLDWEERLFDLVDHLNRGWVAGISAAEQQQLAELNLRAGRKAIGASAYRTALAYLDAGLAQLAAHPWRSQYALCLALHTEAVKAAFLSAEFARMDQLAAIVLEQSQTPLDRVQVSAIQIEAYGTQGNLMTAIATGLAILNQLGISLPTSPTAADVVQALEEIKRLIATTPPSDLLQLPPMQDPTALAGLHLLVKLGPVAFISALPLSPLIILKQVELSLRYGNAPASAVAYSSYGMLLCGLVGDLETGYAFGQLAIGLVSQAASREFEATVLMMVHSFISHWKIHLRATLPPLQQAHQIGVAGGDFAYAGYAAFDYCTHAYLIGQPLGQVQQVMQHYSAALQQIGQQSALSYLRGYQQAVDNLLRDTAQPYCLAGAQLDERHVIPELQSQQNQAGLWHFYTVKLPLCYLFAEFALADQVSQAARQSISSGMAGVAVPILYFYEALTCLALLSDRLSDRLSNQTSDQSIDRSVQSIDQLWQRLEENQRSLAEWSLSAPMNYRHKLDLIAAEQHRVLGQKLEAIECYDQAIAGAKAQEYIQEEALANELAARFYWDWGKTKIAQVYLREAHYCYLCWGATAKVRQLEARYPLFATGQSPAQSGLRTSVGTGTNSSAALDLATVMKASQAIASEIVLENLLRTLMHILLENAGAQTGCLLLPTADSHTLDNYAIAIYSQAETTQLWPAAPVDRLLPTAVLQYVVRTREYVLLDHADQQDGFRQDPYLQAKQPLSLLCYPLLDQSQLVGLVYLENQVTTGALTGDRVELLQLLSGQIAIALTNAQLYARLKSSERQLKQFLEAVPIGIGVLDANGHPYYMNQRAQQLLGKEVAPEAMPADIPQIYQVYVAGTSELYPDAELPLVRALKGEASTVDNLEVHQGDRIISLEAWGTPIYDAAGQIQFAITAFQDITKRKQAEQILSNYSRELEQAVNQRTIAIVQINRQLQQEIQDREQVEIALRQSQEQLRLITDSVPAGIAYVDAERRYRFVNQTYELRFNRPREAIIGRYVWEIIGQDAYNTVKAEIDQVLQGQLRTVEFDITYDSGNTSYITSILRPDFDAANAVIGYYLIFFDITERKQLEESLKKANDELERLAAIDGLTQIANRRRFDDYFAVEWQRHHREQQPLALILIDIDYFKQYNDHYGHQGGDNCLIRVAQALMSTPQRPTDLVARYGGEEFAAILPNTTLKGGLTVAQRMRSAIAALAIPHTQSQVSPQVTLSLGIAVVVPTLDIQPQALIAQADQALYQAKHQGRNRAIAYLTPDRFWADADPPDASP